MEHIHFSDRVVDLLVDEQFKQFSFIFDLAQAQLLFVGRLVPMASNASSPSNDSIGMAALSDEATSTDMSSICDDEALEVAMLEMTNVPTGADSDLPESWNPLLCDICQDEPKKNSQRYGHRCQPKVRKAQKRAKMQGKLALQVLWRRGLRLWLLKRIDRVGGNQGHPCPNQALIAN